MACSSQSPEVDKVFDKLERKFSNNPGSNAKRRLLLIANARMPGQKNFEHCAEKITKFLGNKTSVLFIPHAKPYKCWVEYAENIRTAFSNTKLRIDSLHEFESRKEKLKAIEKCEAMIVGGGSTFHLFKMMQDLELTKVISERILSGMPYVGTSAGSIFACVSMKTSSSGPLYLPKSLYGLKIVQFDLSCHYPLDDESLRKQRDKNIKFYHFEMDTPVVALPNGVWIEVTGEEAVIGGMKLETRLFKKKEKYQSLECGDLLHKYITI